MTTQWWGVSILVFALAVTVERGLEAGEPSGAADPAGFEKGLARIESLHERGRTHAGMDALRMLLAKHGEQPYVRGRRAELEVLAKRLAFRLVAKPPDPQTLVTGDLSRWDATSGKIKVTYTPDTAGDLRADEDDEDLYFPMALRGPTTIEIVGSSYPSAKGDSPRIRMRGGYNDVAGVHQGFLMQFGVPTHFSGGENAWAPARLLRYDDDEWIPLGESKEPPAKRWEAYKLKLKISRTSIQASFNNRTLAKGKKHRDVWGYLAFWCKGWDTVVLTGQVEPSWLQAKAEAALVEQRQAFDADYDASKYLPAWLLEAQPEEDEVTDEEALDELPARVPIAHESTVEGVQTALEYGEYEDALALIQQLKRGGVAECVCAYLEAMVWVAQERFDAALPLAERCVDLAPGFVNGLLLRVYLLRALDRREACLAACDAVIAVAPERTEVYELAAMSAMMEGDLDAARRFARCAARHGASSERLDLLNRALIKAEKGPNWARTYEHRSNNYHVLSDIDKKTCVASARLLEEAYAAYTRNFGCVGKRRKQRFRVYLFSGRAGFIRYQEEIRTLMGRPSENAAGLYSPLLKQLLIWNLPQRDEMLATVRHEGFHQYFDRYMASPPTWLNEGLAEYHEDAEMERGRLVFGQVQPGHVRALKEAELLPLQEFFAMPHRTFYECGRTSYAQAWAFVHMLRHGSPEHRKLFTTLVDALQGDAPPQAVIQRLLPEPVLTSLDKDLKRYVASLAE